MSGNRVKEKLRKGQIARVVMGHSPTSATVDFLGLLGFDGVWLEGEHGPVSWDTIGDLSRACDLWGLSSLVRIHGKEPGLITRTLDCGDSGLIIPHVNTRAEAEQVVRSAKFAPLGNRGIFQGRRGYGAPEFYWQANDETMIVVLIEEERAIGNLAGILMVDHIDVFFVAPADLAQTMGLIGQIGHPKVQRLVEKAIRQIVAAGRVAGAISWGSYLQKYRNLGARFLLSSYDDWITMGARAYLERTAALRPRR